jgi:hypothetical protein
MSKLINLSGQIFGKLTVLSFHGVNADGKALWECRCDCGNIAIKRSKLLRNGKDNLEKSYLYEEPTQASNLTPRCSIQMAV